MEPAARPSSRLQSLHKHLVLGVGDRHEMLVLGEGALFDIGAEFLEGGDALALQAVIFGAKVAVDFGVTGLMAARITKHVLGEQILRVAA